MCHLHKELRPIPAEGCVAPLRGAFLGDPAAVAEAAARVVAQTAVAKPEEDAMLDAKLDVMLATEAAIKLDDAPRTAAPDHQDN